MRSIICDIDGVLLRNNTLIPGADKFVQRILTQKNPFLLLTNYPSQTPADLQHRLAMAGIHLEEHHFYTSAMATADFLKKQSGNKAFVIGEGALTHELYRIGFTITDIHPDFVIVGETRAFNWEMIHQASQFIVQGARFIATNPDVAGPGGHPACGALCAPIERISGKQPFYIGKPNPYMLRAALNRLNAHTEKTTIIGDNMQTDILAGVQAGVDTILVLTGVHQETDLIQYPYQPNYIFSNVGAINVI